MIQMSNNRLGEINYNNFGSKMEIVNYRNANDIDVYFEEYDCIVENAVYNIKFIYAKCLILLIIFNQSCICIFIAPIFGELDGCKNGDDSVIF